MALGWAIISTGLHPDNKIVPAINAAAEADLVAVYSRDLGRAQAFAEKHGAKAAYDCLEELLKDSRVDAVFEQLFQTVAQPLRIFTALPD